jgi:hypothetical protein
MPAGTLNDFLAGFFVVEQEALEVDMAPTGRSDKRKNVRRQGNPGRDDADSIKIDGEKGKEKTVLIRGERVSQKKVISVWSWYQEFAAEWCRTL